MPTTYSDQFFLIDPFSPPPVGTLMNFSNFNLTDQNDDNDFDAADNDSVDGSDITQSYPGDTVTINVPGVGNVTYVGVTFYLADGRVVFTPNDGQVLQDGTLVSTTFVNTQGPLLTSELGPPCFAAGTLICTPGGEVRIEHLETGDLISTLDHGAQPVRWIGRTIVEATGKFAPVVFRPGSIGNANTLRVSPQHRILVQNWKAELYFGKTEVLVPAKHLIDGLGIAQERSETVTYFHLMFDHHEIIISEGVYSESFFPGDQMLLPESSVRSELLDLFPELNTRTGIVNFCLARPALGAVEAAVLHNSNFAR